MTHVPPTQAVRPADATAYLLLEDGTRFDGIGCGAPGPVCGEVVFTTSMSGYQEAMSDPSFAAQLVTFTVPHVGNYGVAATAMESDRIHARAAIMRAAVNRTDAASAEQGWCDWLAEHGVPGIAEVDTRALVRHIREAGAMRGGVFPAALAEDEARALIADEPQMAGRDLTDTVTPEAVRVYGEDNDGPLIVALDTGIKRSIVDQWLARGVRLELHPARTSAAALRERSPDAVFLASGPGDPGALDALAATVRELLGTIPIYGICLGHQLVSRAIGLETYKLPFGHRGANHPVKDLASGRIAITSQNHGFAVLGPGGERRIESDEPVRWETPLGIAELTHINLYDRTVEGLALRDVPAATVQYHPEAGPGPHDSFALFDQFLAQIEGGRRPPGHARREVERPNQDAGPDAPRRSL